MSHLLFLNVSNYESRLELSEKAIKTKISYMKVCVPAEKVSDNKINFLDEVNDAYNMVRMDTILYKEKGLKGNNYALLEFDSYSIMDYSINKSVEVINRYKTSKMEGTLLSVPKDYVGTVAEIIYNRKRTDKKCSRLVIIQNESGNLIYISEINTTRCDNIAARIIRPNPTKEISSVFIIDDIKTFDMWLHDRRPVHYRDINNVESLSEEEANRLKPHFKQLGCSSVILCTKEKDKKKIHNFLKLLDIKTCQIIENDGLKIIKNK